MRRNLTQLTQQPYDLVIIGGGIYGAATAWEASLRGLSVALVEKSDFGSATSANSLKVIHGGLRYLQHADFKRTRESICERKTLMRIAPHLIHPLPVMIPTYGYGMKGKQAFAVGLKLYDIIGFDRNRLPDPQKHIPSGRVISKDESLRIMPGLPTEGLTGGAIFYDAQVYNSERLIISFLKSAAQAGATITNYVEVTGFLTTHGVVTGVKVKDTLSGNAFDVQAKMVVNTAGPWIDKVLTRTQKLASQPPLRLAKAINLITRPLIDKYAVGFSSQEIYEDADAIVKRGSRFYFIAPWRDKSMIGTDYLLYDGDPDDFEITEAEVLKFLNDVNQAYPPAKLKPEDITFVHGGLVPVSGVETKTNSIQLMKHYQIQDYRQKGLSGLISVVGVKYTTARDMARKTIDYVYQLWGQQPSPSKSAVTPLYDGQIDAFDSFLQTEIKKRSAELKEATLQRLIYNYGSAYPEVLRYFPSHQSKSHSDLAVIEAEVLHGIHHEMAQKLTDIIFRRTELGTAGYPGREVVEFCATVMGRELNWSQSKITLEIQAVNTCLRTTGSEETYATGLNHRTDYSKTKLASSAV
ncbi:MAG TPA: glycerol-3-phosphate dehydrogenase/oxidase [Anaerolineae bacterium]|nr:glycerol-3-phosphate dehydrogenase/oxidase [Anaerolineae bacterium]